MIDPDKTETFKTLFTRIYPKAKKFAYYLLKSESDAEDIVQDVFVKLWLAPEHWIDKDLPDAYVYAMTKNAVMNFLRHKYVIENYCSSQKIAVDEEDSDFYEELYAKELNVIVNKVVDKMPDQRRKVFIMSKIDGLSNDEIAERLSLSKRTIERHLYLALAELKKIIYFFSLLGCVSCL